MTPTIVAAIAVAAIISPFGMPRADGQALEGDRSVVVDRLVTTVEGAVYAVERPYDCGAKDCFRLTAAVDGGSRWDPVPARGWRHGEIAAPLTGPGLLVNATGDDVTVSADGGATFRRAAAPGGVIDVRGDTASAHVVVTPTSGTTPPRLVEVPGGTTRTLPPLALDRARLLLNPAYPRVPAGSATAIATGVDPQSDIAVVASCDAAFRCGRPARVAAVKDVPQGHLSPSFAGDHTMFVTTTHSGMYRSTDGGATFQPVVVVPAAKGQVIVTVPALTFTPDFDARARRGRVYAAVISVVQYEQGGGRVSGGVYVSDDVGRTWQKVGAGSPLDNGATALTRTPDGRLFAAYAALPRSGGVLCSDDGQRWRTSCPGPTAADPRHPPSGGVAGETPSGAAMTAATATPAAPTAPGQAGATSTAATGQARGRPATRRGFGGVAPGVVAAVVVAAAAGGGIAAAVRHRTVARRNR